MAKKVTLDEESQQIKKLAIDISPDVIKVANGLGANLYIEDKESRLLHFIAEVVAPAGSLGLKMKLVEIDDESEEKKKKFEENFKMTFIGPEVSGLGQLAIFFGLFNVAQERSKELLGE